MQLLVGSLPLAAQESTPIVPDPTFGRGGLRRLFLGDHYRDLWLTPIRVPVLDLSREHGGLTPTKRGGGLQTKSLRFQAGNGREYVFRNVRKDAAQVVPEELRETLVEDVVHDQMSAMHPAGALVMPPILEAAGVLHAVPRFFVMPDDPRLGEFRDFAGQLGMLEERPTEAEDDHPGFAGARRIEDTAELIEEQWKEPWIKVDAHAFLTARLLDLYVGDWDRHEDQWRWALVGNGDAARWVPIPRDRDQAFVRYDGLLLGVARISNPQLLVFDDEYARPVAATWNGRNLDRRFLTELPRSVWDSTARFLQRVITDAVIDTAVGRMPPELFARNGEWLREMLIERRDGLQAAAIRTYEFLAEQVRIQASDRADHAQVDRGSDGRTTLRLMRARGGAPWFERTFLADETEEIQLDLRDGDDRLVIRGEGEGPLLRVIGGSGADTLIDSSRTRHSRFYDAGDATVAVGRGVDRGRYRQPADTNPAALPERDWGSKTVGFPTLFGNSDLGIAVGYSWTRNGYGFRRQPYASRLSIGSEYAFGRTSGRFQFDSRWKLVNRDRYITLSGLASGIETLHFFGFGNDTEDTTSTRFYRVHNRALAVAPGIGWGLEGRSRLHIQVQARHTTTDLDNQDNQGPISELAPYGTGEFGQAGLMARYEWDSRDYPNLPTRGLKFRVESAYYPLVWSDAEDGFGTLEGMIGTFISPGSQEWLTFAFRAGGRHTYGDVPYFEAAYLGGTQSLRGYPRDRYAGESAVYGSAEVRLRLGRAFLILPGEIGVFGLTDAGRVFVDTDTDSGDWHSNAGGGVFFAVLKRSTVVSLGAAQGSEGARFYLGLGMGY